MLLHKSITGPYVNDCGCVVEGKHEELGNFLVAWKHRGRREGWRAPWPGHEEGIPKYHINHQGWRCNTVSEASSVWFVGCSETFGQTVPQGQTVAEHYSRITGVGCSNLGWPGSSNAWNAQLTINRALAEGYPEHVFFQFTTADRFYVYRSPGVVHHWHPHLQSKDLPYTTVEHHTRLEAVEQRQWQIYSSLLAVFGSRITFWTPFPTHRVSMGIPDIPEWGMPLRVPDDLAQDAAHSNGGRHLRWAQQAAEIWTP